MYTTLLAALVAAPAAVSALGNAIVQNKCSGEVYLWSVDIDQQTQHTIAAGGSYSEAYRSPSSGGVSIKMSDSPLANAYVTDAITQFEYTLAGNIWYDISNINGYPFSASGVSLIPGSSSCPAKICPAGVPLCSDAYNVYNDDTATGACNEDTDTTLVLCSDSASESTTSDATTSEATTPKKVVAAAAKPAKVAKVAVSSAAAATSAPATSAASSSATHMTAVPAAIPVVEAAPDAGVFTTFVTQIITIAVRDALPEPTAAPAKRDEATAAMQKRAAHRHHFHRHAEEEQQ